MLGNIKFFIEFSWSTKPGMINLETAYITGISLAAKQRTSSLKLTNKSLASSKAETTQFKSELKT